MIEAAEAITGTRYGVNDISFPTVRGRKTTIGITDMICGAVPLVTRDELFEHCAGHFLSEELPNGWQELSYEDQCKFMADHPWEYFEGCDGEWIWDHVDTMASSIAGFLRSKELRVEDSI
jgi:hypothetical protein